MDIILGKDLLDMDRLDMEWKGGGVEIWAGRAKLRI